MKEDTSVLSLGALRFQIQEAETEEQAAPVHDAKEIEARLALREAEKRRLKPKQEVWIEVNRGRRPAKVLAVMEQKVLLEYVMPKGSTALRLVQADDPEALIRSVSYHQVLLLFLRMLAKNQIEWIGEPQTGRSIGSPAVCLQMCTHAPSLDGHKWQSLPQRSQKLLFRPEGLTGGSEEASGTPAFTQDEATQARLSKEQGNEHASA